MKKEIEIPKGCKKITIEVEDGKMIVTYCSGINSSEFLCEETGEMEERPKAGDFAVFWNDENRRCAVVANFMYAGRDGFTANDYYNYGNAVKFRNYEQYLKIKGIYGEDEP